VAVCLLVWQPGRQLHLVFSESADWIGCMAAECAELIKCRSARQSAVLEQQSSKSGRKSVSVPKVDTAYTAKTVYLFLIYLFFIVYKVQMTNKYKIIRCSI